LGLSTQKHRRHIDTTSTAATVKTMKKLHLSLVAVKRITSNVPATEFNLTDLETAALTSLQLGGFITPPVLRRTGTELDLSYEVVTGHFQYHAACIAREIDYLAGETIGCVIIEPETETAIREQLQVIPAAEKPAIAPTSTTPLAPVPVTPAPVTPTATPTPAAPVPIQSPIPRTAPSHLSPIAEIKEYARLKGINPIGDKRKKATWLTALAA
jgi:hypothetical protein